MSGSYRKIISIDVGNMSSKEATKVLEELIGHKTPKFHWWEFIDFSTWFL